MAGSTWARLHICIWVTLAGMTVGCARFDNGRGSKISAEIKLVGDFIEAFHAKDVEAIMQFFADGAIYHNMPMQPLEGKDAIRPVIQGFVSPAEEIMFEVLSISQSGSTVLTERVDRFLMNGKWVELPVMGAFEVKEGKIVAWRDYFDMATWQRQTTD